MKGRRLAVKGKKALVNVVCPAAFVACHDLELRITARSKKGGGKGAPRRQALQGHRAGQLRRDRRRREPDAVKLKLTGKARKALARKPKLNVRTELRSTEVANAVRGKAKLVAKRR